VAWQRVAGTFAGCPKNEQLRDTAEELWINKECIEKGRKALNSSVTKFYLGDSSVLCNVPIMTTHNSLVSFWFINPGEKGKYCSLLFQMRHQKKLRD